MSVSKVSFGGNDLINLESDTVTAATLLSGYTAHNASGDNITGTIQSLAAQTYRPGTTNLVISSGQYLSGDQTIRGDANLVSGNIISGKSIFGVIGMATKLVKDTLNTGIMPFTYTIDTGLSTVKGFAMLYTTVSQSNCIVGFCGAPGNYFGVLLGSSSAEVTFHITDNTSLVKVTDGSVEIGGSYSGSNYYLPTSSSITLYFW